MSIKIMHIDRYTFPVLVFNEIESFLDYKPYNTPAFFKNSCPNINHISWLNVDWETCSKPCHRGMNIFIDDSSLELPFLAQK